jgi:hypothetical protein
MQLSRMGAMVADTVSDGASRGQTVEPKPRRKGAKTQRRKELQMHEQQMG